MTWFGVSLPYQVLRMASPRSVLARALVWGLGAGVVVGGLIMRIAWEHNPMGEFHDKTGVQWAHWLSLGAISAAFAGLPVALVAYAVLRPWGRPTQQ